jgi:hypothetical protein
MFISSHKNAGAVVQELNMQETNNKNKMQASQQPTYVLAITYVTLLQFTSIRAVGSTVTYRLEFVE